MSEDEQKRIFAENLTRILEEKNKPQREIASALGISPQAVNSWCLGTSLPRMGKIQALADYLNVPKSQLIEEQSDESSHHDDTVELAKEIMNNDELHALFSAVRNADPEDLEAIHNMYLTLKRKER